MKCAVPLLLIATLLPAASLAAQAAEGRDFAVTRVRIRTAGTRKPTIGIVTKMDGNTVQLGDPAGDITIPRKHITRMEVSRGVHANILKGARIGGLIGGVLGFALGIAATQDPWLSDESPVAVVSVATGVVALGGGLVGAGLGALSSSERWERVQPSEQHIVRIVPVAGGAAVAIGMRF